MMKTSMMQRSRVALVRALLPTCLLLLLPSIALAQACDDFNECSANDMCMEGGVCMGTLLDGSACDDGSECTTMDRCQGGFCRGTAIPDGTRCNDGCGRCTAGFCTPDLSVTGQSCDDGLICTSNDRCQFGFCFGDLMQCPDTDGNACTLEVCNPLDGSCFQTGLPPCTPCQACRDVGGGNFECVAHPDGTACDDFNVCTGDGQCTRGFCADGQPGTPGPEPTATATNTPDAAPTSTPEPSDCPGDCSGDGDVTVDEIIAGVSIALGNLPVGNCTGMDTNADGEVTVDEILQAVNAALGGC